MQLRSTIDDWLRTIGCTPVDLADETVDWHTQIDYPVKTSHVMHVVSPRGKPQAVVIASALDFGHDYLRAFETFDDDSKKQFLAELRHSMNSVDTDYEMAGVKGPLDCPTRITTSVTRYSDGLTLDSFARSVGAVFKNELATMIIIADRLAPHDGGTGGRFDFGKLGI